MPFIMAYPVVSFLRHRAYTKKHGDGAAEQRDEPAAIARQILPAAVFPRFPTRELFADMLRRLDVSLQVIRQPFSGVFRHTQHDRYPLERPREIRGASSMARFA